MDLFPEHGWTLAGLIGLSVVLGWACGLVLRGTTRSGAVTACAVSGAATAATWVIALGEYTSVQGALLVAAAGLAAWGAGCLMHKMWLEHVGVLVSRRGVTGQGG